MNRPLTEQEKEWMIRGLKTLETGEYFGGGNWIDTKANEIKPLDEPVNSEYFLNQIDNLRVVGKCNCGAPDCHTIQFQHFDKGKSASLVCYHTEDNRMLIILINEDTGKLAELEII
ncbi:MAG TPA: hypothetical protein VGB68_06075 [Pyrinomonadaceae bacterium]|jgi:hypothetical protein